MRSDPGLMARAVEIFEERQFVLDIVVRVRCIAAPFDRMRELSIFYREADEEMTRIRHSCVRGESDARYKNLLAECAKYRTEATMLTSFVYYEISSIVRLLRGCFQVQPGSSLAYLIGVRDKILVHPWPAARVKNSASGLSKEPILHAHLVGGMSWVPSIRNYYEQRLSNQFGASVNEKEGEEANVKAILSCTQVKDLPDKAKLLLKTHNIPEPNPLDSAKQLAAQLSKGFLERLQRACARTV